jgi:hypothetical protein
MTKQAFKDLNYGTKLFNTRSNITYEITNMVSEHPLVFEISNQIYLGMMDSINENTCEDYITR